MSYAFSDQQSKLSSLIADDNTGTTDQFPLAQRKKELNRGEMAFTRKAKCVRETATGTVSASRIAIPADFLEMVVLIVNNYVITKDREVAVEDWERFYNYSGNIPMYYMSQESGTRYINFFGTVNGLTYRFIYWKKPTTELSLDADESILPEEFREGPVYYAAAELLRQIGKEDLAQKREAKFLEIARDAQEYAEKLWMTKAYARPDTNLISSEQDIIGGGFDYALGGLG